MKTCLRPPAGAGRTPPIGRVGAFTEVTANHQATPDLTSHHLNAHLNDTDTRSNADRDMILKNPSQDTAPQSRSAFIGAVTSAGHPITTSHIPHALPIACMLEADFPVRGGSPA